MAVTQKLKEFKDLVGKPIDAPYRLWYPSVCTQWDVVFSL
jgi:hypothetical protein